MKKSLIALCLVLVLGALLAPASGAAPRPGSIDPSFAGGLLRFGFGLEPGAGGATHVGLQPDGRAIVLIPGTHSSFDYSLARLTAEGAVDASFGSAGYVTGDFGFPGSQAVGLAVQPDGKVLVAGRVWKPGRFAVTRYTADGQLDPGFGEGGTAYFERDVGIAGGMLLQPDGKVVLSGVDLNSFEEELAEDELEVVRLYGNGAVDRGFGDGGAAVVPIPKGFRNSTAQGLAWHDGKLTVAAYGDGRALLVRLAADGSLDRNFGNAGTTTATTNTRTMGFAVQPDGKILVSGKLVTRLLPDGSRDPGFGSGGVVELPENLLANAVSPQPDGRLVLAGLQHDEEYRPTDFAFLRLAPDGGLDPTVGGGSGYVLTDVGGGQRDEAMAEVPLPGGGWLLAGLTYPDVGNYTRFTTVAAARYGADGSLDPSFGGDGTVSVRPMRVARDMVFDLAVDDQGGVVATGSGGGKVVTARFLPNGALDPGFGTGGRVAATVSPDPFGEQGMSIVRYPDGRVLVGTGSGTGGALLRYLPDGRPDPGFGSEGVVRTPAIDEVLELELDAEGRIVAAGIGYEPCQRVLARFDESGAPDPTFGEGGAVAKDLAGACRVHSVTLEIAPGGRILLGGTYLSFLNAYDSSGKRIEGFGRGPDGRIDRVLPARIRDIDVDRAGRIVVAGAFNGVFGLVRLRPDGTADRSFGIDGRVRTRIQRRSHISAMRVEPSGRIVAAGTSWKCRHHFLCHGHSLTVVRYRRDGSLDPSFGRRGISLKRVRFGADLSALALGRGSAMVGGWAIERGEGRQWLLARLNR